MILSAIDHSQVPATQAKTYAILSLFLLAALSTSISMALNISQVRSVLEVIRPIFLMFVFLCGFMVGRFSSLDIRRALVLCSGTLIVVEIAVCISQYFGLSFFEAIYSTEKARLIIGPNTRITGTFANPNTFAWYTTQLFLLLVAFSSNSKKWLFLVPVGTLLLLSGSRSNLLIFPVCLGIYIILRQKGASVLSKVVRSCLAALLLIATLALAIVFAPSKLNYLYELFSVFDSGTLSSVHTVALRFLLWETRWEIFSNASESWKWFVGLGPIEAFRVLDNDFLYILLKQGLFGLAIHLIFYFVILWSLFRRYVPGLSYFVIQHVLGALLLGLQADTLGGWFFPILPIYFFGIHHAFESRKQIR